MKILLAYFRLPSVRTSALVYFLIAGVLTRVPLFDYLGYEFSAVMTIPAALISGLLTISFITVHMFQPLSRRKFLLVITHYVIVNATLLLVPLAVISLNAFAVKNCSYTRGLMYFGLLPVCTMVFAVSLSLAVAVLFKRAKLVFVIVVAAILSDILFITYTQPQLFSYNFILGYFPGITYDETLNSVSSLLLFREFTLIASLLCLSVFFLCIRMVWPDYKFHENVVNFRLRKGDTALYASAVLCAALLIYGHLRSDELGFRFTASEIQHELGGSATSGHFDFYFSDESLPANEVRFLKAEAEYQYGVVVARMKESLHRGDKISVYLYPNGESKRHFIGTSTTNIAKPWRREIHLTLDSFEDTFRHELVHVLASGIGIPVIHASDRLALNEGLATAVDWSGKFSPHEYAAALQRENLLGDPAALFTYSGFASQPGSYAYIVAGSFCRYLIDRFGVQSFKQVFPTAHFVGVYGRSLDELTDDWKQFLRTVDGSAISSETVRTLFAQQSIFRKTCARVTADRNSRAVQAIRVRNYEAAEDEFLASFEDARTAFALRGLFQSLIGQKKYGEIIKAYDELDGRSMLRYNPGVLFLLGDALWLRGRALESLEAFRRVEEMNYSDGFSESAALRRMIVREPRLNSSLREYYYGNLPDSARGEILRGLLAFPDSRAVARYLQAGESVRKGANQEGGIAYRDAMNGMSDQVLLLGCSVNAAHAFYRAGEFEESKSVMWRAQNLTHLPMRLKQIEEWIDRCDIVAGGME